MKIGELNATHLGKVVTLRGFGQKVGTNWTARGPLWAIRHYHDEPDGGVPRYLSEVSVLVNAAGVEQVFSLNLLPSSDCEVSD